MNGTERTEGTEWTEPGQGATGWALYDAAYKTRKRLDKLTVHVACGHVFDMGKRWTNLRLTGAPLTADDLKRIAEAK